MHKDCVIFLCLFSFHFFLQLFCISLVSLIFRYSAQILLENTLFCRQNAGLTKIAYSARNSAGRIYPSLQTDRLVTSRKCEFPGFSRANLKSCPPSLLLLRGKEGMIHNLLVETHVKKPRNNHRQGTTKEQVCRSKMCCSNKFSSF